MELWYDRSMHQIVTRLQRRSLRLPWQFIAVLLVVAVVWAAWFSLRQPPPQTVAPTDATTTALLNFYQPETSDATTFRWSGPGAALTLPAWAHDGTRLTLHLNGDYLTARAAPAPPTLLLQTAHAPLAEVTLQPGWRTYHMLLRPTDAPTPLYLTTTVQRPAPTDDRYLGFPLAAATVAPHPHGAPNAALQATAMLFAVLCVAAALGWLWQPRSILAGVAVLVGGALAWAWLAPASVYAAVPHLPAVLLVLLLTGGGALALARGRWHRLRLPRLPLVGAGTLVVALLLLLPGLPYPVRGVGALVLLLLPGVLLTRVLLPRIHEPAARLTIDLCGGFALWALLLLALHVIPGAFPPTALLLACGGISVAALVVLARRPPMPRGVLLNADWTTGLWLVVLLGGVLRLWHPGLSEFQGDEARAIMMAGSMYNGQDDILLLRPKGPVEVLYPAGLLALTGSIDEGLARLPFILAGCGLLAGVVAVARLLAVHHSMPRLPGNGLAWGLLAAAFVALDGFMLAFARLVQYQSIILLLMTGAVWCLWQWFRDAATSTRLLLAGVVLAAVAILAHYDGMAVLPALAALLLLGGAKRWRRDPRRWLGGVAVPVLLGGGLLASFYVPFVLHEHFRTATADYLAYRLSSDQPDSLTYNNLPAYYQLATFYSTTYQINVLLVLLTGGVVGGLLALARGTLRYALAGLWLVAVVLTVAAPATFALPGGFNWAVLAFGVPLAGLVLLPGVPVPVRVLVLWFATPFVAMAFLIAEPRTHYYPMNPPATLLAALTLMYVVAWLRPRVPWARPTLVMAGVGLAVLVVPYLYIAFLRPQPEYLRDFPTSRPDLYRAAYGDSLPTDAGYFAFPQRDGWAVVGDLYRTGVLQGSYSSNKKPLVTTWYLRGIWRCDSAPDTFLLARGEAGGTPDGYGLQGTVLVDGRAMLDIYTATTAASVPRLYHLHDYRATFAAAPVPPFPTQGFLFDAVPQYRTPATWQNGTALLGYDLYQQPATGTASPGTLALYWDAKTPAPTNIDVAVYNATDGTPLGTARPICPGGNTAQVQASAPVAYTLPATPPATPLEVRVTLTNAAGDGSAVPLTNGRGDVRLRLPPSVIDGTAQHAIMSN